MVFEQQPKSGNILDLPQRKDLHDLVWNGMRQILLVWFKGDWDAVQRLLLYLEDEGGSLETFDRQSFWLVVISFVRAGKALADWPASFWLGFHRLRPDLLFQGNY